MDTSQFDAKIKAAIDEKESLKNQMEQVCQEYIRDSVPFLRLKLQEVVDSAITRRPEVTKSIGLEKLKQLKLDLKSLHESLPQIVTEVLDRDELWEHRSVSPQQLEGTHVEGFQLRDKAGSKASDEFKKVLGRAGLLVIKHGLVEDEEAKASWRKTEGETVYGFWLQPSKELLDIKEKYKELFKKYVTAHMRIGEAQTEKDEAEAKDLWDQA